MKKKVVSFILRQELRKRIGARVKHHGLTRKKNGSPAGLGTVPRSHAQTNYQSRPSRSRPDCDIPIPTKLIP